MRTPASERVQSYFDVLGMSTTYARSALRVPLALCTLPLEYFHREGLEIFVQCLAWSTSPDTIDDPRA